jgi:hypothetical protein
MNEKFEEFRKISGIVYPPFALDFFERHFFNYIQKYPELLDRYIPVFWTEINNMGYDRNKLQAILDSLPQDGRKYFTICQHADGIHNQLQHTEVFFLGGRGDTPLALIYDNARVFGHYASNEKTIFCSFVGANTHPCRVQMCNALRGKPGVVLSIEGWTNKIPAHKQTEFLEFTSRSKFTLAPRGYGRTSFRLYEAFKLNSVPVYVYDDPILPYTDVLDWSKLAVLVHTSQIDNLYSILQNISDETYEAMRSYYKEHAHLFTYDGMSDYIIKKVLN